MAPHERPGQMRVARHADPRVPDPLSFACRKDASADDVAPLSPLRTQQLLLGETWHPQTEVDAVEQWSGQLVLVELHAICATTTMSPLIAVEPARTGVGRRDQREPCGELDGAGRPRHDHTAVLQRLAQTLERVPAELRELVEEQHAVVRERDLSGTQERGAAAEQAGERHGMMRGPERTGREHARVPARVPPPSGAASPRALPRVRAPAGSWRDAAPASSCRPRAVRPSGGCVRPRRPLQAPAGPAPARGSPTDRRSPPPRSEGRRRDRSPAAPTSLAGNRRRRPTSTLRRRGAIRSVRPRAHWPRARRRRSAPRVRQRSPRTGCRASEAVRP